VVLVAGMARFVEVLEAVGAEVLAMVRLACAGREGWTAVSGTHSLFCEEWQ
jgi:hypothetical protein